MLLIVAPNERKVRIEVGYGLEGTLTDAITSFIIQNAILPRFKAGDFPGGIKRGAEDIVSVLTGDEEYKQRATQSATSQVSDGELIVMIIFVLIAGFIFINVMYGVYTAIRGVLEGLGVVSPRKKGQKKSWFDDLVVTSGSSGGSSGSSWSSGSSGAADFPAAAVRSAAAARREAGDTMISDDDKKRIIDAIREAERKTSGEIFCVVAHKAGNYRTIPFALAAGFSLIVPLPFILWSNWPASAIYMRAACGLHRARNHFHVARDPLPDRAAPAQA